MVITTGLCRARSLDFKAQPPSETSVRVGLFVTCLVDAMRPSIGLATLELLESAGCEVCVPSAQTCCGQPAWNSGERSITRALAEKWVTEFEQFDAVVAPSGSCMGMVKAHYLQVFEDDAQWRLRAERLAARSYELSDFLVNVLHLTEPVALAKLNPRNDLATITYHDSCSGLRELGVYEQPRALIQACASAELREMRDSKQCCGFGGTFAVKYGEVSSAICDDKCQQVCDTGAQAVVLGDLGCMLNIQGRLSRRGEAVEVLHLAEWLTGRKPAELEPGNENHR